jgi:hypothetical protein
MYNDIRPVRATSPARLIHLDSIMMMKSSNRWVEHGARIEVVQALFLDLASGLLVRRNMASFY